MENINDIKALLKKVEEHKRRSKIRIALVTIIPTVLAIALLSAISMKIKSANDDLRSLNDQLSSLDDSIKNKQAIISSLQMKQQALQQSALNSFGWSVDSLKKADSTQINQSLRANAEIQKMVGQKHFTQNGISIRYYQKSIDQQKVILALEEIGFKPLVLPATTSMSNTPTNSIWFGKNVPIEEVKLVAYYLIRGGIEIKSIRPFRDFDGPKMNSIEIGGDKGIVSAPALSFDQILSANDFPREH